MALLLRGEFIDPTASAKPFSELVETWERTRVAKLAPRTRERYASITRTYLVPAFGATAVGQLDRATIKEWFAARTCRIPTTYAGPSKDNPFVKELTGEHFDFKGGKGRARVLPKDEKHSPDLADAFVLTFAADAITLARGRDRDGGKPVERRIRWMAT